MAISPRTLTYSKHDADWSNSDKITIKRNIANFKWILFSYTQKFVSSSKIWHRHCKKHYFVSNRPTELFVFERKSDLHSWLSYCWKCRRNTSERTGNRRLIDFTANRWMNRLTGFRTVIVMFTYRPIDSSSRIFQWNRNYHIDPWTMNIPWNAQCGESQLTRNVTGSDVRPPALPLADWLISTGGAGLIHADGGWNNDSAVLPRTRNTEFLEGVAALRQGSPGTVPRKGL